jgi:hypothetical protein
MSERCPFCGHDPYHYVDNGIGMEAVAVNCCEPGIALFSREKPETVTLGYDEFSEIGTKLMSRDYKIEQLTNALEKLLDEAENFSVSGVYFTEKCMGHKGPALARAALEL